MLTAKQYVGKIGLYAFTETELDYIRGAQDDALKVKACSFVLFMSKFESKYPIQVMMALQHDGWKTTRIEGRAETVIRVEVPIGIIRS